MFTVTNGYRSACYANITFSPLISCIVIMGLDCCPDLSHKISSLFSHFQVCLTFIKVLILRFHVTSHLKNLVSGNLALFNGPNTVGVSLRSSEDGNRTSFRTSVISSYLESRMMAKVQEPSGSVCSAPSSESIRINSVFKCITLLLLLLIESTVLDEVFYFFSAAV
jgi:hypothetical protein